MSALLAMTLLLSSATPMADDDTWGRLPGEPAFASALRYRDQPDGTAVAPFELMRIPVNNGQFLRFVLHHPSWQRGQIPALFAERRYLEHWLSPLQLGPDVRATQPVTRVSWFAADAYCRAQGARLPTWAEWEYAAAADTDRADARGDPAWRERILSWYARPSNTPLSDVGQDQATIHGVHDLNGLIWEWVDDHAAFLVSADNREQGDPDLLQFCGAGALSTDDRENYAVLMRIAMLSALDAEDVTGNLGFRCARPLPGDPP